jgi:hypothetical protein
MTSCKTTVCCGLLFFLAVPGSLPAQVKSSRDIRSCRAFVQEFYDWYMRLPENTMATNDQRPADEIALKQRKSIFSVELSRRLQEDYDAANKAPGELVGLDFDPFLNSQDPDQGYVVGGVRLQGGSYRADVYGLADGKKREKPAVVAELVFENGRWLFLNFHYPNCKDTKNCNLLSILKQLERQRQQKYP